MNANLYALFAAHFPDDQTACAIETHDGRYYSWRDIERASARLANLLVKIGLTPGARIVSYVDQSPEVLLLYLATLRAGMVYVPFNPAYREAEMEYFINDVEPAVVVCARQNFNWIAKLAHQAKTTYVFTLDDDQSGSLLGRAGPCSDQFPTCHRAPDDLAAIIYTSGTTGRSKGAMLSHGNLAANASVLRDYWGWRKNDVLLHTLPLFHIHGLFVASHGALLNGSKMLFLPKFDTFTVIKYLPRATVMMGVPTHYTRLLAEPSFTAATCRKMRLFISGSAPLLAETFNRFIARTGHTILERYGMSETAMLTSNPYNGRRIAGTVGPALPGVSLRIVNAQDEPCVDGEIGHIQVKGPSVFSGYWQMPEKTREAFTSDGFFRTGDLGKQQLLAGGTAPYVTLAGRSTDLVITGGYNVYPKEIETYINQLDGVLESAVIGVSHPDFGEAVTAVVVMQPHKSLNEMTLIGALKAKIANFKVPKRVYFVDQLPRNAMGKVQKNVLRERYSIN